MNDTMSIREAARRVGVDPSTLSKAMHKGTVPVRLLKIGKCVRVPRAAFDLWVSGGLPPTPVDGGETATPPVVSPPPSQK